MRALLGMAFVVALITGCGSESTTPAPSSAPVPAPSTPGPTRTPTATLAPTPSAPTGVTIVVRSVGDGGPGSLRQALIDAQAGDTVKFDSAVFPPTAPATIEAMTTLPDLTQGHVTLDASDAGVIIDGRRVPGEWTAALNITSSWNVVRGLEIVRFSGAQIVLQDAATHNVIGGDRSVGAGPVGQGNVLGGGAHGVAVFGGDANTIAGNAIGIDAAGKEKLPNRYSGIWLEGGAVGNVVGPGNTIAWSGNEAIAIKAADSLPTTITANSFHDNHGGIALPPDAPANRPPTILSFDLAAGTAEGFACPTCTVELFSGSGSQAESFEGKVAADQSGWFSFKATGALAGPAVLTTATATDGSTSGLSAPTSGPRVAWGLQQGNNRPLVRLSPRRSQDLPDNGIGVHFEDYGRYSDTESVYANGFKTVRIQSLTDYFEADDYTIRTFNLTSIPAEVDAAIDAYRANGVSVELQLLIGAGLRPDTTFQKKAEVTQFADYVRFVVSHFKGRIAYYEIWNEPGPVAVSDYANLVRTVVPIIRQEDPAAKIVIGAVPGTWENGYPGYGKYQRFKLMLDYLNALIRSGVAPLVDGISWHPFYDNIPSDPYYQKYAAMVAGIKSLAKSKGFKGEFFADELLWRTVTEKNWAGGPPVSPRVAAKMYARAIVVHRGLGVRVTANTFFLGSSVAVIHNLGDVLAGASPADIPVAIAGRNANFAHYGFAMPNGDRLVAVWSDGKAAENDTGVSRTITLPGSSATKVVAIDVLNGVEQELVIEAANGSLLIRDVLIRDFPTILRLSS